MKRKNNNICLIEEINTEEASEFYETSDPKRTKMPSPKEWLTSLQSAEKTSQIQNKIQKVHYKFSDNTEMVEEYNIDTSVVLRRAWKKPGKLGEDKKWDIEIGDPEPAALNPLDNEIIRESNDQPIMMRRNTRINLEWRIRNLPYPIETYSVAASAEEKCIIIRTTNKKYFKRLEIPELERIGLTPVQANVEYSHKFNTLIITYKKPKELLDLEKAWISELKTIKTTKDGFADCNPS